MRYVTIKDIARELVVSVSTVSRALNNDASIRKETREKIQAAAKRMGYVPNPVATNLKFGRTKTIGVIVPEMSTPYAALVIDGIQDICYHNNYKVIIASSSEDADKERESLEIMMQFMIDGIIACRCDYNKNTELYQKIQEQHIPLVFYDRIPYNIEAPQVIVDDEMKAFFLVEHLIRSGRKNIAYIGANFDTVYNSVLRYKGYREALQRYGLEYNPNIVVQTEGLNYSDGAAAVDKFRHEKTDAVFAFTDTLAIGAMNRLKSIGRSIPKDVAVAGFSGTNLATIVSPQLTTVEPRQFEMGQKAAELIIKLITNPSSNKSNQVIIDADIIYRNSTEGI
ncbi:MAG: LacI family DNA-binding transcriptional regulator [Bacteroidaceae bacterium]|nr:LacI family DNA-binding transcriptional regulator [Bacteroidaceae bacterium]